MNGLNYSPRARKYAKRAADSRWHFGALSSYHEPNALFLQCILTDNYYSLSDIQLQLAPKHLFYPLFDKVLILK